MGRTDRRPISMVVVDTFAAQPFRGSPCPVCFLPYDMNLDEQTMGNISLELNMAEVVFVKPLHKHDDLATVDHVAVRWFKPEREVKLCGHGAFATAALLFYHLDNKNKEVTCATNLSGDLVLRHDGDVIRVDFPLGITVRKTAAEYEPFIKSLKSIPDIEDVVLCPKLQYLLVSLKPGWSRQELEEWRCDMTLMEHAVAGSDVLLVIVTTAGEPQQGFQDDKGTPYDFLSRVFVPFSVRPEDPVTGSAMTVLAHYWSQKLGKRKLFGRQCSHRGGEAVMEVEGDRVHMMAHATVVMEGALYV